MCIFHCIISVFVSVDWLFFWECKTCALCVLSRFSHAQLFATLLTVAHQAPLSMGFFRQEYWSGLPLLLLQGIFLPRDRTCISHVSCLGRLILYHYRHLGSPCRTYFPVSSYILNSMLDIINFTFLRTKFYCFNIVRICLAYKLFGDKMNPFKLGVYLALRQLQITQRWGVAECSQWLMRTSHSVLVEH